MSDATAHKSLPKGDGVGLPIRRCACGRRLFDGFLVGILKCPRCNRLNKFIDKIREDLYDDAQLR